MLQWQRKNRTEQRRLHPFCRTHEEADNHGNYLQGVGKSYNPNIRSADCDDIGFVCIDSQYELRVGDRRSAKTPKMGAAGAAVGTLGSGLGNVFVLLLFLLRERKKGS